MSTHKEEEDTEVVQIYGVSNGSVKGAQVRGSDGVNLEKMTKESPP